VGVVDRKGHPGEGVFLSCGPLTQLLKAWQAALCIVWRLYVCAQGVANIVSCWWWLLVGGMG
jgi:hypothetical protein